MVDAGFHEQRHVVYDDRVRVIRFRLADQGVRAPSHFRVHDRVQPVQRLRVAEHDRAERRPVQAAIGQEDRVTERSRDLREPRGAGPDHDPGQFVSVDVHGTVQHEPARDGAFSGCDPAGQSYQVHACHATEQRVVSVTSGRWPQLLPLRTIVARAPATIVRTGNSAGA